MSRRKISNTNYVNLSYKAKWTPWNQNSIKKNEELCKSILATINPNVGQASLETEP